MGHHYVPQKYLRAFGTPDDPDLIWAYDKKALSGKILPIKIVAQAPAFYEEDVEAELASRLEGPANIVLDQLINLRPISQEQRTHLAVYIATMMKRVPRRRRLSLQEIVPKALEKTMDELVSELQTWAATTSDQDRVAKRLAEIERLRAAFRDEPPAAVMDHIRNPWPTVKLINAVGSMTWRMALTTGSQRFITSDNPAFFFEDFGIGTPNSEITFPISPRLALMASRKGVSGATILLEVKEKVVREANRRMAASAERFVFSAEPQLWLTEAIRKPKPYLSRINW